MNKGHTIHKRAMKFNGICHNHHKPDKRRYCDDYEDREDRQHTAVNGILSRMGVTEVIDSIFLSHGNWRSKLWSVDSVVYHICTAFSDPSFFRNGILVEST